jgi:anti-sigma-K factor RskA
MNENTEPTANLCDDLLMLIPAYALGAADQDEVAFIEAHLAECPEAQAELAEYRRVADLLSEDVPQVDPPPALRAKIQAALPTLPAPILTFVPPPPPKESPWRGRAIAAFIGLAAALALLVISTAYWSGQNQTLTHENEQLAAFNAERQSVISFVSAPDTRSVVLALGEGADGNIRLYYAPNMQQGIVIADNLATLAPDRTYQVWLLNEGQPLSVGVFDVNSAGQGTLVFDAPASIDGFQLAAITEEPAGGSELPTSDPIAVGEIAA